MEKRKGKSWDWSQRPLARYMGRARQWCSTHIAIIWRHKLEWRRWTSWRLGLWGTQTPVITIESGDKYYDWLLSEWNLRHNRQPSFLEILGLNLMHILRSIVHSLRSTCTQIEPSKGYPREIAKQQTCSLVSQPFNSLELSLSQCNRASREGILEREREE